MIRTILILVIVCMTTALNASNKKVNENNSSNSQIIGKVKSINTKNVLPMAQVVVYGEESNLVKVTTTNQNGNFVISSLPEGKYYLVVSYLGYKSEIIDKINITSNALSYNIKNLKLKSTDYEIKEVVVKADRINNNYFSSLEF